MPGGLALDGTFGFKGAPPYPPCCGTSSPDWGVDSFDLSVDDVSLDPIYATDSCNGDSENISGSFSDWWSGNTSIATVTNKAVTGVSVGTTTANASGVIFLDRCIEDPVQLSNPITVPNSTPIVTGISPSDWTSGTTTPAVTITGQYFGTNAPTLTFSPSAGISYSLVSNNDTQIVANIAVASGTPNEDVSVSVTNNGYGGFGVPVRWRYYVPNQFSCHCHCARTNKLARGYGDRMGEPTSARSGHSAKRRKHHAG